MFSMKLTSISLVALAFAGGTAFAATTSTHAKMAPSEVKTMKECQAMKQGVMMKNKNCMALQKKYPGEMKASTATTTTASGKMKKKSSTGGGMKSGSKTK